MPPRWVARPEGLRHGQTLVSFQRYPRPPDGTVTQAPRSLGALPVARGAGLFCLPLGEQEAFWLGLLWNNKEDRADLSIDATDAAGGSAAVNSAQGCTDPVLLGLLRPDGRFNALCPPNCVRLSVRFGSGAANATAVVLVVTPVRYALLTGKQPPATLDLDAGYKGWRLP